MFTKGTILLTIGIIGLVTSLGLLIRQLLKRAPIQSIDDIPYVDANLFQTTGHSTRTLQYTEQGSSRGFTASSQSRKLEKKSIPLQPLPSLNLQTNQASTSKPDEEASMPIKETELLDHATAETKLLVDELPEDNHTAETKLLIEDHPSNEEKK